jgi:hypothetical protein
VRKSVAGGGGIARVDSGVETTDPSRPRPGHGKQCARQEWWLVRAGHQ